VTSVLTLTEAHRALVRAVAGGRLGASQQKHAVQAIATFARKCDIVALTDEVLARAGRPFPREPVRTLDAIHLATTEALGEPPAAVTMLTRELRIRDNAKMLGYNLA
jgi:predicted nucleic acid-binding protein